MLGTKCSALIFWEACGRLPVHSCHALVTVRSLFWLRHRLRFSDVHYEIRSNETARKMLIDAIAFHEQDVAVGSF